jgi:hypothetical protein
VVGIVSTSCTEIGGPSEPSGAEGGPIGATNPHGWAVTRPVGTVFTDGLETFELNGDQPAVIKSVELIGEDGLELVGFSLVRPERELTMQIMDGYPPRDPELDQSLVIPGEGATITPTKRTWELLLGIKVTEPGYLVRDAVRIHYTAGGEAYTRTRPAQLVVCTSPTQEINGRCPFPEGEARRGPAE